MLLLAMITAEPVLPTKQEQAAVRAVIERQLKDPGSSQYRWQKVRRGPVYCAEVNSKNSFGGYTGFSEFIVFVNSKVGPSDVLPGAMIGEPSNRAASATVAKFCREAGYFSE